jgi:UDP-N-acetylglucosamine transferase subunit ALG13
LILGVTGTGIGFERLVSALADYARSRPEERIWLQHGPTPLPSGVEGRSLVSRAEMLELMRAADVIVCHGGSGTLFDALMTGHVPVVVPRRHQLGEHVNDHQLELPEALQSQGRAIVVRELAKLGEAVAQARGCRSTLPTETAARLRASLRKDAMSLSSRTGSRMKWIALRVLTAWVPLRSSPHEVRRPRRQKVT